MGERGARGVGQVEVGERVLVHLEQLLIALGTLHALDHVLLVLRVGLDVVDDGLEGLLAQRTLGLHLAPLQQAVEAELVQAAVREALVAAAAEADGAVGRRAAGRASGALPRDRVLQHSIAGVRRYSTSTRRRYLPSGGDQAPPRLVGDQFIPLRQAHIKHDTKHQWLTADTSDFRPAMSLNALVLATDSADADLPRFTHATTSSISVNHTRKKPTKIPQLLATPLANIFIFLSDFRGWQCGECIALYTTK